MRPITSTSGGSSSSSLLASTSHSGSSSRLLAFPGTSRPAARCLPPVFASIHHGSTTRRKKSRTTPAAPSPPAWLPYVEMLRLQNVAPSMLLVLMGAWTATRDVRLVLDKIVGVMAVVSALVAVGSCVLNDWFDVHVDRHNHPERTLAAGKVQPHYALGLGVGCLALALLVGMWAAPSGSLLALIVRLAVVAVTLYTPVFKPVPFLKNGVVAAVTAASVTLGGLASGAALGATLAPALVVFCQIYHREILMDITDTEGDAQFGIWTLPRLLGKRLAMLVAMGLFALGTGVASSVHWSGVAGGGGGGGEGAWFPLAVVWAAGAATCVYEWRVVWRHGFRHEDVSRVIAYSPIAMAVMLFLMGVPGGGGVA